MKRNLIILMIDGGRLDYSLKSPTFISIKKNSICLSQPITYGPHTIAAMHAVFSGSYGTRTGTNSYWSTYNFKKNKFKTISEYLHDENYYTKADVVNDLVIPKQGLDEFLIHDELNDNLTLRHQKFLQEMKIKNDIGQNFFLYLQYSNIHTGIMNEVLKVYNNFSEDYFNSKEKNKERYQSLFESAEKYLTEILKTIDDLELSKNSMILIMSDHGISIGEKIGERAYGAFCYDYTLRTFAYFLTPDLPNLEISQQVRTIDFMPTILDYFGISLDLNYEKIDGESLLPLFGGKSLPEKIAFSETGNPLQDTKPPKEPNIKSVRTSEWKLIFNEYNETRELYDLVHDPHETNNLSGNNLEIETVLFEKLQILSDGKI
ncbi:sulfatase-like hydrolase/transferase [Nitrosopumilus sp.]|uniref:sulfatase family protein n=1 Tax=Nitrosopumilus sp. TaxID=2024843 RepID=UPI00247E3AB6|nr:sulfatase-like hydrolase/transferase [Nitrosopumilus sp.]MCV0430391.1 sulfatase-like hydrolase/transferase [Nitrosopumilus sp.]